jgi:putative N6-adenine-specific DNA methylase
VAGQPTGNARPHADGAAAHGRWSVIVSAAVGLLDDAAWNFVDRCRCAGCPPVGDPDVAENRIPLAALPATQSKGTGRGKYRTLGRKAAALAEAAAPAVFSPLAQKSIDACVSSRYAGGMTTTGEFEIFLATSPGLEAVLCAEARAKGFKTPKAVPGGVTLKGGWPDVWRANLEIRGAGRVVAELCSFRVLHLAQLDKRARRVAWADVLRRDVPFRVEATCKSSRIYHSGAAAQRVETAIREELGAPLSADAEVCVRARIENDLCTISIDTSGELLHKRGHKQAVNKAPMRETMASLFLRQCGYAGSEPVVDPMCGSGTFVIEAAEIAAGLKPGRTRQFAFEKLATFDAAVWHRLRESQPASLPSVRFYGSDRDAGAIAMSRANAARAGVTEMTDFQQHAISDLVAPAGPPGLVIVNPPYGDRIGDKKTLHALYRALGHTLMTRFQGWRVGLITNDAQLAHATGLPFGKPSAPVSHGGLRVTIYTTGALP